MSCTSVFLAPHGLTFSIMRFGAMRFMIEKKVPNQEGMFTGVLLPAGGTNASQSRAVGMWWSNLIPTKQLRVELLSAFG